MECRRSRQTRCTSASTLTGRTGFWAKVIAPHASVQPFGLCSFCADTLQAEQASQWLAAGSYGTVFRGVWASPKGRKDVAVKQFKGISLPSDEMKELSFLQTCRSAELDALVKHWRAACHSLQDVGRQCA